MATNYERGRAFEYRVRDWCKENGAVAVIRAAGSHGPADVVAFWRHDRPWFIQAKRDGKLPVAERELMLQILRQIDVKMYLAQPGPNGRGVQFTNIMAIQEEANV